MVYFSQNIEKERRMTETKVFYVLTCEFRKHDPLAIIEKLIRKQ